MPKSVQIADVTLANVETIIANQQGPRNWMLHVIYVLRDETGLAVGKSARDLRLLPEQADAISSLLEASIITEINRLEGLS